MCTLSFTGHKTSTCLSIVHWLLVPKMLPHCLLRGDALVLTHEQEIEDSYLSLEWDDVGLLLAALGWFVQGLHVFVSNLVDTICSAIGLGELDHVNETDYMFYAIDVV